jgi:hypothetical protein
MNTEVTTREVPEVTAEVKLNAKEYRLIQVALWTLKNEVNEKMSRAATMEDINKLYVYAQEVTELKHDLFEAFNINQKLEF